MDTGLENDDREEISQSKDQNGQSKIKLPKININDYMERGEILAITNVLYNALHDSANVSENTLVKLLKLNEIPLFSNIGMGFLISLLPESSLEDFIYIKMDMIAKDVEPITAEFGKLNFKALYNEITTLQSRLSNRTYDLRISEDDLQMERMRNEEIETNN